MSTTLKIKVTKEILERSKNCTADLGKNCAIALAVRDIFPMADVGDAKITPFYYDESVPKILKWDIALPATAREFINAFDALKPQHRARMRELEFEIKIPDSVLEQINIEELRPLLQNHPTLELVTP